MASTRDYDLEKKRWRWTYHLFRGVVAVCLLYVAGAQIIERARGAASAPAPPAAAPPPPVASAPPSPVASAPPPVASAPPAQVAISPPPPREPEPPPLAPLPAPPPAQPPAPPPPPQVVEAPPRPMLRVLGQAINGRAGPGSQFGVVRTVSYDLVLVATGETQNDWLEVFVRGGPEDQRFWVYRQLVRPEPR